MQVPAALRESLCLCVKRFVSPSLTGAVRSILTEVTPPSGSSEADNSLTARLRAASHSDMQEMITDWINACWDPPAVSDLLDWIKQRYIEKSWMPSFCKKRKRKAELEAEANVGYLASWFGSAVTVQDQETAAAAEAPKEFRELCLERIDEIPDNPSAALRRVVETLIENFVIMVEEDLPEDPKPLARILEALAKNQLDEQGGGLDQILTELPGDLQRQFWELTEPFKAVEVDDVRFELEGGGVSMHVDKMPLTNSKLFSKIAKLLPANGKWRDQLRKVVENRVEEIRRGLNYAKGQQHRASSNQNDGEEPSRTGSSSVIDGCNEGRGSDGTTKTTAAASDPAQKDTISAAIDAVDEDWKQKLVQPVTRFGQRVTSLLRSFSATMRSCNLPLPRLGYFKNVLRHFVKGFPDEFPKGFPVMFEVSFPLSEVVGKAAVGTLGTMRLQLTHVEKYEKSFAMYEQMSSQRDYQDVSQEVMEIVKEGDRFVGWDPFHQSSEAHLSSY